MVDYNRTEVAIIIKDSSKTPRREMLGELVKIRDNEPYHPVFRRKLNSLKAEWIVHNFLYKIGFQRDRTMDCDLDYPCDKPEWLYKLISIFVKLFIK